jgi:hypothetical protein
VAETRGVSVAQVAALVSKFEKGRDLGFMGEARQAARLPGRPGHSASPAGRLVTSRQLLTAVRGDPDHIERSYLRINLAQLRRKLDPEPSRPRHLLTEPGVGYRFQP